MATRLQTTMYNLHGEIFKIYLDDSAYASSAIDVEGSGQGFTLRYDGDASDPMKPILPSELRYSIRVDATTEADIASVAADILTAPEGQFTIRVDYNTGDPLAADELYWCGYVLPDLSGFSDETKYEFTFTATDGLGRLKAIDYKDDTGASPVPWGNLTFIAHVTSCLIQDGLSSLYWSGSDVFLRTSVNWQDGNMSAPTANKCPLAYSRVNGIVFAKRNTTDSADTEWDFMSCYEVLETIARHWGARVYMSGGCYRFEQINERAQDQFYERRFRNIGALVSSTATADYDKNVLQASSAYRLAQGRFQYLAPVKEVWVEYKHETVKNWLALMNNYWYKNSTLASSYTISNITVDGDTYLRISGSILLDVELQGAYTGPWRYVMGLSVEMGGETLNRDTVAVTGAGGNPIPSVQAKAVTWAAGVNYYELSTGFTAAPFTLEPISFSFDTPVVPSDTEIVISFVALGARLKDESSVLVTVNDWRVINPDLRIIGSSSDITYFERTRRYHSENATTGNSKEITVEAIFGHAVKGWTEGKIQTSSDASTWTDTTATWDYDTDTDNYEFGALLAQEIQALYESPRLTYSGEVWAKGVFAHSRIAYPDTTAYLLMAGEYAAKDGVWSGDWFAAGVNRLGATKLPAWQIGPKAIDISIGTVPVNPEIVKHNTGQTNHSPGSTLALDTLAINYIGTTVTAGTITSIGLEYPAKGSSIFDGDTINVYNPSTGEVVALEVATDVGDGDTSISVISTAIDNDLPAGAQILMGNVNHWTNQGSGATGGSLPAGTDKQTLRYNGTTIEANSALQNDGTYIAVGATPSTSYMLSVKQNASNKGLFVERNTASTGAHIYHDGAVTLESVGGNNLKLTTASGSILDFRPGGGGGQTGQMTITPNNNVTSTTGNGAMLRITGTYAPTASGGDFSGVNIQYAVNQTSAADQICRGININPTLTAVLGDFRGLAYQPSTHTFLYQANGTAVKNHLIGNLGIGTGTTSPAAKIDVVGNGATSATHSLLIANSTPDNILSVRNDKRIGILTTSPSVTVDASTATDGVALPGGTTAQRPSVNNTIRYNSTVGGYEGRVNGVWYRLTSNQTPSASAGAAAGTSPGTPFVFGNDLGGQVSITTGTSCTTGTLMTITWAQALDAAATITIMLTPKNQKAAEHYGRYYVGTSGNTSFVITVATALDDSTEYIFNYSVNQ